MFKRKIYKREDIKGIYIVTERERGRVRENIQKEREEKEKGQVSWKSSRNRYNSLLFNSERGTREARKGSSERKKGREEKENMKVNVMEAWSVMKGVTGQVADNSSVIDRGVEYNTEI